MDGVEQSTRAVPRWVVVVAVVVGGWWLLAEACSNAVEELREERAAEDARAARDVELVDCGVDDRDRMVATVEVVNGSSERSNYLVEVAFTSPDGSRQLTVDTGSVRALLPDQVATEEVASLVDAPAGGFDCEVVEVSRSSDE